VNNLTLIARIRNFKIWTGGPYRPHLFWVHQGLQSLNPALAV